MTVQISRQVEVSDASSIPLIDLDGLYGPRHSEIIQQIGLACQHDGFFQVKNHGVSEEMINIMLNIARRFFKLPESERLKSYSDDPSKTTRLSTSFNVKTEKVASWRDFLRIHCYPDERYVHEWPTNPPSFRYSAMIGTRVLLHRAVVNCNKERISIPTFYCPSPDALIGPAKELIDHNHPAAYTDFTYAEYHEKFWKRGVYIYMHLIINVDNKSVGDRIDSNPFVIPENLKARHIILKKNSD
ncbi:hypothetical protein Patl1_17377 [Pistacia atlantica]|uniref:Uncharacterized protein n=1 Tax=Pistacia atlantica TaxID=434234 RepID=A0ACC1C0K5_9ROSI|nr:hypothetical protein Patl1_17377 [Pistacia atlantica]